MQQNYLDAMTIVKTFGKPDLFITMTANPKWPEIRDNLRAGEEEKDEQEGELELALKEAAKRNRKKRLERQKQDQKQRQSKQGKRRWSMRFRCKGSFKASGTPQRFRGL